jgi:hypothetical protein
VVGGAEASWTLARIVQEEVSPTFISTYASTPRAAVRTHGRGGEDSFGTARGWGLAAGPHTKPRRRSEGLWYPPGDSKSRGPGERRISLAIIIIQAFVLF